MTDVTVRKPETTETDTPSGMRGVMLEECALTGENNGLGEIENVALHCA